MTIHLYRLTKTLAVSGHRPLIRIPEREALSLGLVRYAPCQELPMACGEWVASAKLHDYTIFPGCATCAACVGSLA